MSTDERVLDAALRVFQEVGFRAATTRRIAAEAGVNEVTLFRRFESKERLLLEAMRYHAARYPNRPLPAEPQDPRVELALWAQEHLRKLHSARVLIRTSMCELEAHPALCDSATRPPARLAAELRAYLERLRDRGLATGAWDVHIAASMLMGTLFADAIGAGVVPDRHPYSPDEAAARYVALFLRAIGADAPPIPQTAGSPE